MIAVLFVVSLAAGWTLRGVYEDVARHRPNRIGFGPRPLNDRRRWLS
ncbi:MAG TPA: hypothetical protein VGB14_01735 [Acidimicrobiales bacterium]